MVMRWSGFVALCLGYVLLGCGDDDGARATGSMDGGVDAATGSAPDAGAAGGPDSGGSTGAPTTGGAAPPPPAQPPVTMIMCGDLECVVDMQSASMGVGACCTDEGECGATTPLNPAVCLAPDQPGGPDLSCPEFVIEGFVTWGGCCTPDGQCGALDTGNFGCIPNVDLNQPESSCTPDPDNTCERLVEVTCDGAEDCDGDQVCCGQYLDGYRRFVCRDDCQQAEIDEGGIWSNICHPGDGCTVDGYSCMANESFLPSFLYRCRDTGTPAGAAGSTAAGEVNCGDAVCGSGQKCCLSEPGLPRCTAAADPCTCLNPPPPSSDGGLDDGGSE